MVHESRNDGLRSVHRIPCMGGDVVKPRGCPPPYDCLRDKQYDDMLREEERIEKKFPGIADLNRGIDLLQGLFFRCMDRSEIDKTARQAIDLLLKAKKELTKETD